MVRQRQGKARRAVVPFIVNITMEINFSGKVYCKSLLKVGLHDRFTLSCASLEEIIFSPHNGYRYFRKMGKEIISSPHNGYQYFSKGKESHIFSTEWILLIF